MVMPGATSMRRLDDRLRWRRRRGRRRRRRRRGRTGIAADLGRLGERLVVGVLQRAVHRRSSRCRTAGRSRTPATPTCSPAAWCLRSVPTHTAVDSDGVKPTIQASRLAPVSPSWLVPVLAADGRPPASVVAVGVCGDRLHGGGDVVGDGLVDALLAGVVLGCRVEQHLALGVDHLLHEVRRAVDARCGDAWRTPRPCRGRGTGTGPTRFRCSAGRPGRPRTACVPHRGSSRRCRPGARRRRRRTGRSSASASTGSRRCSTTA